MRHEIWDTRKENLKVKMLRSNLILNPSPQGKDFQKEEIKSSPLLWRGVGGEVFWVPAGELLEIRGLQIHCSLVENWKSRPTEAPLSNGEESEVKFLVIKKAKNLLFYMVKKPPWGINSIVGFGYYFVFNIQNINTWGGKYIIIWDYFLNCVK